MNKYLIFGILISAVLLCGCVENSNNSNVVNIDTTNNLITTSPTMILNNITLPSGSSISNEFLGELYTNDPWCGHYMDNPIWCDPTNDIINYSERSYLIPQSNEQNVFGRLDRTSDVDISIRIYPSISIAHNKALEFKNKFNADSINIGEDGYKAIIGHDNNVLTFNINNLRVNIKAHHSNDPEQYKYLILNAIKTTID